MVSSARVQVGALARALEVLQRFTENHAEWAVGELAEAVGLPKGSVSKILNTFLASGFVAQDPHTRRYRLGPAILAAGRVATRSTDVTEVARPFLEGLQAQTGETAMLMLRAGWRSVLVAKVDSDRPVRMSAEVGRYASLHTGASNKPILAFMDHDEIEEYLASPFFVARGPKSIADRHLILEHLAEIRHRGFAVSESEVEEDVRAVGAPIFAVGGKVIGAVSIAGPANRLRDMPQDPVAAAVRKAAREISGNLGWLSPDVKETPFVPS